MQQIFGYGADLRSPCFHNIKVDRCTALGARCFRVFNVSTGEFYRISLPHAERLGSVSSRSPGFAMDEAGFITPETAIGKAFTVAAFRSMSPRFPDGLVIQQWFKERNPQLLVSLAAMIDSSRPVLVDASLMY